MQPCIGKNRRLCRYRYCTQDILRRLHGAWIKDVTNCCNLIKYCAQRGRGGKRTRHQRDFTASNKFDRPCMTIWMRSKRTNFTFISQYVAKPVMLLSPSALSNLTTQSAMYPWAIPLSNCLRQGQPVSHTVHPCHSPKAQEFHDFVRA